METDKTKKLICPVCKREMEEWEIALSRKDNKTEICSQYGQDEAMAIYNAHRKSISK